MKEIDDYLRLMLGLPSPGQSKPVIEARNPSETAVPDAAVAAKPKKPEPLDKKPAPLPSDPKKLVQPSGTLDPMQNLLAQLRGTNGAF